MLICCPNCETGYQVAPQALGEKGRTVRCARCQRAWFATPEAEPLVLETIAEPEFTPPPRRASDRPTDPLPDPLADYVPALDTARLEAEWTPAGRPESADARPDERAQLLSPRIEPVVADAPSLAPTIEHVPMPSASAGDAPLVLSANGEIKTAAKPKPKRVRKPFKWPRPGLRAASIVLVGLVGGLLLFRSEIVRFAPQTASLYGAIALPVNLRGLTFENVTSVKEQRDGVTVLVVEGTIVSASASAVEVPRLRLALRGEAGNEVYVWTAAPNRSILAPGETLPFKTRLASPPPEGRDVLVRFAQRREVDNR
jgi:predicted Zn finger-like uncharacterized protein